jgi:hypothetical protein
VSTPFLTPSWPVRLVNDGQSLGIYPYDDGPLTFYRKLGFLLEVPIRSVAVGGMGWLNLLNGNEEFDVDPAPVRWEPELFPTSQRNGLIMFGGQGDLSETGAVIYDRACDYADAAHAFGFDFVVCLTITPVSVATWGGPYEPQRSDFNTLLLANAEAKFDGVVDLSEIQLSDGAPTYLDGLHLDYLGAQIAAEATAVVVEPLLTP